jgi:N-acyl-D-aspartate/D-glutamate deacylase
VIREGNFADVVVFDAETVCDRATFDEPHQTTAGLEAVVVNGTTIIRDGTPVESLQEPLPGRYLKYGRDD